VICARYFSEGYGALSGTGHQEGRCFSSGCRISFTLTQCWSQLATGAPTGVLLKLVFASSCAADKQASCSGLGEGLGAGEVDMLCS
jgi:hypothetical protein